MTRALLLAIPFVAAAAAAAFWAGDRAARSVEAETASRAEGALQASGHQWARVIGAGARLAVSGEAPDEAARDAAIAAVASAAPWATVSDTTTLRAAPARFEPTASVEILRSVADLTITGAAPGADARRRLVDALRAAAPRPTLTDVSRDDAALVAAEPGAATDWGTGAKAAAEIAADLLHGRVHLAPPRLETSGLTGDEDALRRIQERLAALAGEGWTVSSDLAAPPPAAQAFEFRAEMDDKGGAVTLCSAETEEDAERILAAARERFAKTPDECRVAPGAPDAAWADAALAGMKAVMALPAGRISLVGRRARLTAQPPTRLRALEEARALLFEALPENYRLAVLSAPAAGDDAAAPTDGAAPGEEGETLISYDGETLRLTGRAPNPVLADATLAFARARFAGAVVEAAFDPESSAGGADWRKAATALMDALTRLRAGEARLTPSLASLEGEIDDASEIRAVHGLVADGAGEERRVLTRLTVSPARQAAETRLPVSRCAEALNAVVGETPIDFAPGSTALAPEAAPIIARLLEALEPCAEGRLEIGGHTDSQGAAEMNQGLSRARATAVLDALLEAGANPAALVARGYGEEKPIADNGTETGRARNRRIEFRALPEEAEEGDLTDAD